MVTKDYITQKFQSFGVQSSDADVLDVCTYANINEDDVVDANQIEAIGFGLAKFIPQLLLRATSINESGFSMSWNIEGIKEYYSILCKHYGLDDELSDTPKISFL
jgi:hypothetical protein